MTFTYRVGKDTTYNNFDEFLREQLEVSGLDGEYTYESVTIEVVKSGKSTFKDYQMGDCYDNIGEAVRKDLEPLESGMVIRVLANRKVVSE